MGSTKPLVRSLGLGLAQGQGLAQGEGLAQGQGLAKGQGLTEGGEGGYARCNPTSNLHKQKNYTAPHFQPNQSSWGC